MPTAPKVQPKPKNTITMATPDLPTNSVIATRTQSSKTPTPTSPNPAAVPNTPPAAGKPSIKNATQEEPKFRNYPVLPRVLCVQAFLGPAESTTTLSTSPQAPARGSTISKCPASGIIINRASSLALTFALT